MVIRKTGVVLIFALIGGPAGAETLLQAMFPDGSGCYARSYSPSHLAKHTEQLVTDIVVAPVPSIADPVLELWVEVDLRGDIAGHYAGYAYCEQSGESLSCGMEGDAGLFTLTPDNGGKIQLDVGRYGMSFEGDAGFITLKADRGDDRSFLLDPVTCG